MRINTFRSVHLALLGGIVAVGSPAAGQQDDSDAVDAAVVAYVRADEFLARARRVGFDPDRPVAGRSRTPGAPRADSVGADPTSAGQAETRASRIARALGMRAVTTSAVLTCPGLPSSCRFREVDAIVHWRPPAISGDTVTVSLTVLRATGLERVPVQRLTRQLVFARGASGWMFVRGAGFSVT